MLNCSTQTKYFTLKRNFFSGIFRKKKKEKVVHEINWSESVLSVRKKKKINYPILIQFNGFGNSRKGSICIVK